MGNKGIGEAETMAKAMKLALANLKTQRISLGNKRFKISMFYNSKITLNDVSVAIKLFKKSAKRVKCDYDIYKGRKDRQAKVVLAVQKK